MKSASAGGGAPLCWIGGPPAHYTRRFHRELLQRHGDRLRFVYLRATTGEDSNESLEGGQWVEPDYAHILDAVEAQGPSALLLAGHRPLSLLRVARWARRRGLPVAYWSDTNLLRVLRRPWWHRVAERSFKRVALARMRLLLHVGSLGGAFYLWLGGEAWKPRLRLLPYPALLPAAPPPRGEAGSVLRVLYLGRLAPEKAVDHLVQAFALSPELASAARLTIAGDGPERGRLERLAGGLPGGVVSFAGAVPSAQVASLFEAADVLVLPSHRDAWGLVVNEALGHGVPVVAPFWVGAVKDLVRDGATGVVLPDNAPPSIASALSEMASKPRWVREMGEAGSRHVRSGDFNLPGALRAFDSLLAELLP